MVDFRLSIAVVIGIILSSIIITSAVFVITSNGGSETRNPVSYTKDNSGLHEISNTDLYTKDNTGLTVIGMGVVGADPDVVEINLGVEVIAKTVGSANEKASTSMSRLQKVISQYDIEDDDLKTSRFNVSPQYNYRNESGPEIIGFRVTNTVTVKFREMEDIGSFIDDAVSIGGNNIRINNIYFKVENSDDYLNLARKLAIENARNKAELFADAAKVQLGSVVRLSDSSNAASPMPRMSLEMASPSSSSVTPISPGQQDISIQVSVTFEIR